MSYLKLTTQVRYARGRCQFQINFTPIRSIFIRAVEEN
jgi:hypothetical protein